MKLYSQQLGGLSKAFAKWEKPNTRLHIDWFHFHDILEKAKPWGQEINSVLPGRWRRGLLSRQWEELLGGDGNVPYCIYGGDFMTVMYLNSQTCTREKDECNLCLDKAQLKKKQHTQQKGVVKMSNPGPESHRKRMERCALQSALVTLGGSSVVMRQKLRTEDWVWQRWLVVPPIPISFFFPGNGVSDFQKYSWLYRPGFSTQAPWKLNNIVWMNSGQRDVNETVLRQFLGAPSLKGSWWASFCCFCCAWKWNADAMAGV